MYYMGLGVERNLEKSIEWYELAAKSGHPVAQNNYPMILFEKDPVDAVPQLLAMAKVSNSPLIYSFLGDIYSSSLKLPESLQIQYFDDVVALNWYLQAGENGNPYGYHRAAKMYLEERGDERSIEKVVLYLEKAAEMDYESSIQLLVKLYTEGLPDLEPDEEKAAFWTNRVNSE